MTEPRLPRDLDVTLLDQHRVRPFRPLVPHGGAALAGTLVDAGRRARAADPPAGWPDDGSLPDPLARRYKLVRRLDVPASQADLFLVRVRETGEEAVLKRYHDGRVAHPDLASYLSTPRDHIVRFLEIGPGYEVMEHLPGGSLREWRERNPAGFDYRRLRRTARQVAAVLIGLHRQGLVHRDVKPANIMLRATERDLAVIDFGIAGPPGDSDPAARPNPAYQPPEVILGGPATPAGDWWALGMTLAELAAGEHPFEGLTPEDIEDHFRNSRPVDVSGVPDEPRSVTARRHDRLRNLCQGLLASDPAVRWEEREVGDWLVGRDPELPGVAARTRPTAPRSEPEQVAAAHPYVFHGVSYLYRDDLAQGLATAWNHAVEVLLGGEGRLDGLRAWLEQFGDDDGSRARRVVDRAGERTDQPGDVRLLRIIRALDPTRPAVYRHYVISRRNLRMIAHRAMRNEGDAVSVLSDLWTYRLLPTFDTAAPAEAGAGGEAFADLDREWRAQRRSWSTAAELVTDPDARRHLTESVSGPELLAVSMRAALRQPDDLAAARELVRGTAARLPGTDVPWFGALAARPELVWVALLLCGHAESQARSAADRRRARAARAEALRASALLREWSRRQNRPAALGWAVAGVCLMAAVWIALIIASDTAGWAGDTAVAIGWVGAAGCAGVSLVVESLFAAEVGGRFHPRYSIPGAGAIALGPLGRWLRRAWLPAGGTTLGVLAGVGLVACLVPQLVAVGTTAGHLFWVVRRWRAWEAQVDEEDALIAEAEQREPSGGGPAEGGPAEGGPSGMDEGTRRGDDT